MPALARYHDSVRYALLAVAALLLVAACTRGTPPVHVSAVRVADGALSGALREAGLDDAAVEAAARAALTEAGFRLGSGERPHRARLDIVGVRLAAPVAFEGGPRAEVTVEIELSPAESTAGGARRETASASAPLAPSATPREAWLAALGEAVRRAADGLALSFAEERKDVDDLVADLSASDARVRELAIRVLGDRRSRTAVPALLGRLDEEDALLQPRIVAALVQIGDERAVPALIELSRSSDPAHSARLVRFIGDVGGSEAEGYLLTLDSGHPDARIRRAAREALADMRARAKDAALTARK